MSVTAVILGLVIAIIVVVGLRFRSKPPKRVIKLLSIAFTVLIGLSFLITEFATCKTQGAMYCEESWSKPFASIVNVFGLSFMLGFPIILYAIIFANAFWTIVMGIASFYRKLSKPRN